MIRGGEGGFLPPKKKQVIRGVMIVLTESTLVVPRHQFRDTVDCWTGDKSSEKRRHKRGHVRGSHRNDREVVGRGGENLRQRDGDADQP